MEKKVAVLGSTGSIGRSTLDVVRHLSPEIQVVALAVHSDIDGLETQIREFRPKYVSVADPTHAAILRKRVSGVEFVEQVEDLSALPEVDLVVCAIAGTQAALKSAIRAIETGKTLALASKEVLITAGAYVMQLAHERGVSILPIDSEHSALFQCVEGRKKSEIRRLILTASGGPFYQWPQEKLSKITLEQALAHPTWKMGQKVTVDSSTLMNKGLEVIEARWLFGIDQIDVVIHPQSIIHSMVEMIDGSILGQMSQPDMKLPIQYSLTYPQRRQGTLLPFDFTTGCRLDFLPADTARFRCLKLAFDALKVGGTAPCFLNGANEVLVHRFLNREIGWNEIGEKLETLLSAHTVSCGQDLNEILATDALARRRAAEIK